MLHCFVASRWARFTTSAGAADRRREQPLRRGARWAREQCDQQFGPIALASDAFDFTETDYYAATMGADLKKQFLAFERLIDPAALADIKRQTNEWEAEYAALGRHAEPRPLNLDPGYITPAKLVLASTKDHAHRIYLRDGIYAEVTLAYRQRQLAAAGVDVSRLSPRRLSAVLHAVSRLAVELRQLRGDAAKIGANRDSCRPRRNRIGIDFETSIHANLSDHSDRRAGRHAGWRRGGLRRSIDPTATPSTIGCRATRAEPPTQPATDNGAARRGRRADFQFGTMQRGTTKSHEFRHPQRRQRAADADGRANHRANARSAKSTDEPIPPGESTQGDSWNGRPSRNAGRSAKRPRFITNDPLQSQVELTIEGEIVDAHGV